MWLLEHTLEQRWQSENDLNMTSTNSNNALENRCDSVPICFSYSFILILTYFKFHAIEAISNIINQAPQILFLRFKSDWNQITSNSHDLSQRLHAANEHDIQIGRPYLIRFDVCILSVVRAFLRQRTLLSTDRSERSEIPTILIFIGGRHSKEKM